jgi:hypothetical protein
MTSFREIYNPVFLEENGVVELLQQPVRNGGQLLIGVEMEDNRAAAPPFVQRHLCAERIAQSIFE